MASLSKLKKLANSHQVQAALKHKGKGVKGLSFYNASQRQVNNSFDLLKD